MEHVIHKFYTAFNNKDWQTMQACYHDEATFTDPVFKNLSSKETRAMWHMLVSSAKELSVSFSDAKATEAGGSCRWQAIYKFSKTGRMVHNKIEASFTFKDGKILAHTDAFDIWKWAGMALGLSGTLLGWSPFLKNKIKMTARKGLVKFMQSHPAYN